MNGYWSWWAGALGLAGVAIGHYVFLGMTFGVSGAMERLLFWREEREVEKADALLETFDFDAALAAATAEAFGGQQSDAARTQSATEQAMGGVTTSSVATINRSLENFGAPSAPGTADAGATPDKPKTSPIASQAVFVACIFFGGLMASLSSGKFKLRTDMGPEFAHIVTGSWVMWPVLLLGGILVGFGTRLCGGCSSGHGLNGCSRLQPISLLATSIFFGTAVVVSTLLLRVI
jgi:uncharacterized protein